MVTLRVPEEKEATTLETNVNQLAAAVDQNSAIANMVFATYLETEGLYLSAIDYYKRAIALEPEVEAFQEAYSAFLDKMGLSKL